MSLPLVSIITPTKNNARTISDTLYSIKNQSYKNIEHIIIDGLSSDQTLQITSKINTPLQKIIAEKDEGLYDAINKGISHASGEIIGILHADDFFTDNSAIEKIVTKIQSGYDGVYANLFYVDKNNTKKIVRKWKAKDYQTSSFLYGWMPPHPTCYVKKTIYEKFGTYRIDCGTAADYEWILRVMYKNKITFGYVPNFLVAMRVGGVSNQSLLNRINANKNDRKAWIVNNISPYFFTFWLKPLRKIGQFLNLF